MIGSGREDVHYQKVDRSNSLLLLLVAARSADRNTKSISLARSHSSNEKSCIVASKNGKKMSHFIKYSIGKPEAGKIGISRRLKSGRNANVGLNCLHEAIKSRDLNKEDLRKIMSELLRSKLLTK